MASDEMFGNRKKTHEEEYFRRQEQELIEKLKQRGQQEATRRQMGERSGVADEELLRDLQALGYTPDTVRLLHVVPLLQMAWAEGSVSDEERALILEAARLRGIDAGSAADTQLNAWLTTAPSAELFDKTLRAIRLILEARPGEHETDARDLVSRLSAIASASGGILGFGKVSQQEKEVLARISAAIEGARGGPAK